MTEKSAQIYDLNSFDLLAMTRCSCDLRRMDKNAQSMEEVANSIVQYLYDSLRDGESGERACSLIRFFKTHNYSDLNADLKNFANQFMAIDADLSKMKCLVLLATFGEKPEWNSRLNSRGHQAIPLPSQMVVEQFPMISNLVKQLGIDIKTVIDPEECLILDKAETEYGVFHVPNAMGNPMIPAQENFVAVQKIKSVIGFGGVFPNGDIFAVIIFSKVFIEKKVANLFKALPLSIKIATMSFNKNSVFALDMGKNIPPNNQQSPDEKLNLLQFKIDALNLLLEVQEKTVIDQTKQLYKEMQERRRTEDKLLSAQSQAIISEKLASIGTLSAGVCHEVLNPLNIIFIQIQMLLIKRKHDAELQIILEKMRGEVNRISKIVSTLMTFARRKDVEVKCVNVGVELESALSLYEKEFQADNITIKKEIEAELPELWLDADELRQVILNIVNNAKYAMMNGGALTVFARKWKKNDSTFIRLKFSDTGPGIKKEHLDKIFDPFFTTKPVGKGTGMGLSVVHSTVERYGGAVQVESQEGKGTSFIIDLPLKQQS